ncbi:hypothetical protein [Sorangium sp. So ce341]|uniref:hypothetical protein n=1 Tax=Sorangium sp. So ce341 TaxID=3133302 RepID=UPI003F5F959A
MGCRSLLFSYFRYGASLFSAPNAPGYNVITAATGRASVQGTGGSLVLLKRPEENVTTRATRGVGRDAARASSLKGGQDLATGGGRM